MILFNCPLMLEPNSESAEVPGPRPEDGGARGGRDAASAPLSPAPAAMSAVVEQEAKRIAAEARVMAARKLKAAQQAKRSECIRTLRNIKASGFDLRELLKDGNI